MCKKYAAFFLAVFFFSISHAQTRSLDFFISNGLQNSPLLKDYAEQVKLNALDSSMISATRKPQVDGIGMVMMAPTYHGYGYDAAITNGGNYEAVASLSQTLFAKKIFAPQYEGLRIENQSANNSGKISAHELEKNITDQYLSAYSSLNELAYNQSLLKLLQQEEPVLKNYVTAGIYREVDYLAFLLEKQTQEVQISQLQIQYRADLNQLNVLCGITDTAYFQLAPPGFFDASRLPSAIVSPFLIQFRIDSLRLVNQRNLIDVRYRARVNWFADAGLLTSTPLTMYRNFGLSFGLSVVIPIFDGHQRGFEYQKLSVNENIRMNYESFFSMQQRIHISQLNLQIDQLDRLIIQEKNLLKSSELLVDANKQLLDKGQAAVSDFILAIKSNIDIKSQLNRSEISRLQLLNELTYWNW
jgi:outer membrane protein TolC